MLINAVYFTGSWDTPFRKEYTTSNTFHGANGDREEQFMAHYAKSFLANFDDPDVIALKMPYKWQSPQSKNQLEERDNDDYLFVLLPKESLDKTRDVIDGPRLQKILDSVNMTIVDVLLPRFKIESKLDAKDVLVNLGAKTMFTDAAEFRKISDFPMKVSDVMQKAVVEVNEVGTEAAAATVVKFAMRSAHVPIHKPIPININRPFIYGIASGADILFIGQYA